MVIVIDGHAHASADNSIDVNGISGFKDSHDTFRKAMPMGFSWEVLQVWSGYALFFTLQSMPLW